jgi:peroxiredoxin Q/BCP
MAELKVGDRAPQFALAMAEGTVSLAELSGKNVVLYFYPKDDTEACTIEAVEFSGLKAEFEKAGTRVIGVSPDSPRKHVRFSSKHDLTIDLASDESLETAKSYGVWVEKSMYGRSYMGVERSTFLIGPDSRILQIWRKVRVKDHAADVLASVRRISRS